MVALLVLNTPSNLHLKLHSGKSMKSAALFPYSLNAGTAPAG